jgi:folate-binding protein YgfZ
MNILGKCRFFPARLTAWLRVSGEDAPGFLQGQFSQDIRGLIIGAAAYGLWLNPKGRIIADSFVAVAREPGAFWVGSLASPAEVIRRRLEDYIVADDVAVEDQTALWSAIHLAGEGVEFPLRAIAFPDSLVFADRRWAEDHAVWVVPAVRTGEAIAALNWATAVPAEAWERERIEAAIPAVPADAGLTDFPQEVGLADTAVSFGKGCFVGQEVMARIKTRGRVRRRLRRVRGAGTVPAPAISLWLGERTVGDVRSAAAAATAGRWIALAVLSADLPEATALALGPGQPPVAEIF